MFPSRSRSTVIRVNFFCMSILVAPHFMSPPFSFESFILLYFGRILLNAKQTYSTRLINTFRPTVISANPHSPFYFSFPRKLSPFSLTALSKFLSCTSNFQTSGGKWAVYSSSVVLISGRNDSMAWSQNRQLLASISFLIIFNRFILTFNSRAFS